MKKVLSIIALGVFAVGLVTLYTGIEENDTQIQIAASDDDVIDPGGRGGC